MTLLSKIRKTLAAALATAALYTNAAAQEPKPVQTEIRVVAETEKNPVVQALANYDKSKLFVEGSNRKFHTGADLQHENYKLNLGLRHTDETEDGRALLTYKSEQGFAGVEYQFLDKNNEQRFGLVGGANPHEKLSLEAAVDTAGNAKGVLFTSILDGLTSIGGGGNRDAEDWEVNIAHNRALTDNLSMFAYLRVGDNDFYDARLWLGKKVLPNQSKLVFSATNAGLNQVSKVGDVTFPFTIGGFNLLGVESLVGNEAGDIGVDLRYTNRQRAYAHGAINVGDFEWVKDITLAAKFNRDLAKRENNVALGLRIDIPTLGLRLWYEMDIDEKLKTQHHGYVGFKKEF